MKPEISLEQCHAFINCHVRAPGKGEETQRPAITISRQSGAGGHVVGARLIEYLQRHQKAGDRPWTVFDRNLVDKVLEDHHLPKRLAQFMPEDRVSELTDMLDELFGLHPRSDTLVRQAADTMLRLADLGNVILIGRAANIITRNLDYAFHVRLVGSLQKRAAYIADLEHLDTKAAEAFVKQEDAARKRYVKRYFGMDVEDPQLYHLVINTDLVPYDAAAEIIGRAVLAKK